MNWRTGKYKILQPLTFADEEGWELKVDYDEQNFFATLHRVERHPSPPQLFLEFLDLFSGKVRSYPWQSEVSQKFVEKFPRWFAQEILVRGNLAIVHVHIPDCASHIVAALELDEKLGQVIILFF